MRLTLLIFILCVLTIHTKAQDQKGIISGILADSISGKPIQFATISLFKSNDTTLVSYRLSDEKGEFRFTSLPISVRLRMVITYTGFTISRREIKFPTNQSLLNMGKLLIKTSSVNLNEVMILAERPPIIVRKDTIEFNAAAFKTLPDALVEDLLRKLPGVNVDKDGNIMVNGRKVSTIYVDGKEFFGGDVRIASKNLPANTIDKVQVTNDKEALRFNPFMPEADIPQVINLKLKPGIKKGIFGKMYAGGGVKDKAEIGALVNLFRDTTQISILGYGNNLNKASFSFTDIRSVGGFGRSGWGNANGNGNGGLSIDKVSFGGFGNGLMKSSGGGGNFNTIIDKKVQFSLNYFYGAVISDYDELRNTQQLYNDTTLTTRQNTTQHANQFAHLIGTKIAFDIAPRFRIDFRPQLVLTRDNSDQFYEINSISSVKGALNNSDNNQQNKTSGTTFMSWLKLIPTFKKKGRTLDFFDYTVIDNSKNRLFNFVKNSFFQPPSKTSLDQLRRNDVKNITNGIYFRYTDVFNEQLSFTSRIDLNYFRNENDLATFFPDTFDQYVIGIPSLSENFIREGLRSEASAAVKWKYKKLTFTPGIGYGSYDAKITFSSSSPLNQHFKFLLPTFDMSYGIVNLSYARSFREPALANLQPIINNTNPLFIRTGNPDLKPSVNNSLSLSFRKYDTKRFLTYNFSIGSTLVGDATIISRTVNSKGVQTTIPINSNGTWTANNSLSFQKDWKMANSRQISLIASNNISINNSLVLLNQLRSKVKTLNIRPSGEIRVNLNDKLELNQAYTFTHYKSTYENSTFSDQTLNYHDSRSEIIVRFAQKWVCETQLDYRFNPNSVPGLLSSYYKWNAAVTYIFLKGNRGQLKLAVNDILDQNVLASRMVRENLIEDMQGSTIRRYSLLTFTYNIRNFGDKVGGRNQLFRY